MTPIDLLDLYLRGVGALAIVLAVLLLVSGLDDLLIDVVYWVRRAWRAATVYRAHERLQPDALYARPEQPFAIMVPAWHETGVIGQMADLAARTLDYENYHIFVGTYPNDPETQADVDAVCVRYHNVHKVICARPGPTSKADCLNNVLDAIRQFERRAGVEFAGFILHDAEDVISGMELRLFNHLVARKDLIQLPVYPLEPAWRHFTSAHYMDEFAELHGKDILVREALAGQVPSAGVGTCFSRRAILALLADGEGIAFDVQSLTEDYDIGFRLRAKGMSEIFVRFPDITTAGSPQVAEGERPQHANVICVREFFPGTVQTAVRQKSRWIIGIVYQGFKTHRWVSDPVLNYFLWRDRKGAICNFVNFLATAVLLHVPAIWAFERLAPGHDLPGILEGGRWLSVLLAANLALMVNRVLQRFYFVTTFYSVRAGLLSFPRIFWGQYINFLANFRALRQIAQHGDPRRVAWDKTTHDFPSLGEPGRARRPLGHILVEQGVLDEARLHEALANRPRGLRLGSWLVADGLVSTEQLAAAVAEQSGVPSEAVETLSLAPAVVRLVPTAVARQYAVLPLREEGRTLVLGSEMDLDPVTVAALRRKLGRAVRYVIVPKGQITVGLRHWHGTRTGETAREQLDAAVAAGRLSPAAAADLWQRYVSRQLLFTEILMSLGHLDSAALGAALLRHDGQSSGLGQFLVDEEMIDAAVLTEALEIQRTVQGSMSRLLQDAGATGTPAVPEAAIA
jgi:adsorption protein B